jgi:hypothetical protein
MSPIPQAASGNRPGAASDKVIIQTFESDHETLELRLTATIITSIEELHGRAKLSATPAP